MSVKEPRSLSVLPDEGPTLPTGISANSSATSRREAVRQIGAWIIFAAALDACGPPPSARGKSTNVCTDCATTSGTNTGLTRTDLPAGHVAYNAADSLYVCHDANGFYAIDSICPHQGCDMGAGGCQTTNLAAGFFCNCHGSSFDASGAVTGGPSPSGLSHYKLAIDAGGALWIDVGVRLGDTTCRCH
jgi:Rieske Fe-S protein